MSEVFLNADDETIELSAKMTGREPEKAVIELYHFCDLNIK